MREQTSARRLIDRERHVSRMLMLEAKDMTDNAPQEPMTVQRAHNATNSHNQFLGALQRAELIESGHTDIDLSVAGFSLMGMVTTPHSRRLRFLAFEIAHAAMNYWEMMAKQYVILNDAEKTRAGAIREKFSARKEEMEGIA